MTLFQSTPAVKNRLPALFLLLLLPTAVAVYQLLLQLNEYFGVLQSQAGIQSQFRFQNGALAQAGAFAAGMALSAFFYSFRFRFLPPALLLFAGLYLGYAALDALAVGEFDAFFVTVQFITYAVLLSAGWIAGWGFVRWRAWPWIFAALLLTGSIAVVAKSPATTVWGFARQILVPLVFSIYLVFVAEQLRRRQPQRGRGFWLFIGKRLLGFAVLLALSLGGVYLFFKPKIAATLATYGGGGGAGEEGAVMKKDKDGNFDLQNFSRLQSGIKRSNELVFAAHIDHYFEGTDMPNPLYLTAFYYTRFDASTETFERDDRLPNNDLFTPDPSSVPLFRTQVDSAVYRRQQQLKLMEEVEVEIYSKKLSKSTYLAPQAGYLVQPITVEKDFQKEFTAAFRTRSMCSKLNSAYFIYNAQEDPEIAQFQETRFELLRQEDGKGPALDAPFKRYYTYMPADPKWSRIGQLARQVTAGKKTTIDKVLAIRDYFLSKDAAGDPLFKYTDNPGIPDLPSASRLLYFLFENRQGYCAYYAGATLFMLRSLGVPSRIAVGFLTVDRSGGKNKGWYWYYADQAHAWVQVWFPGYGWLDFDTTVGNDEAQESPKPDGTPPVQPPRALLALDGLAVSTDTAAHTAKINGTAFSYRDKPYTLTAPQPFTLDLSKARIQRDSVEIGIAAIGAGDSVTAVSYNDAFKNRPVPAGSAEAVAQSWPEALPIDEVYVRPKRDLSKEEGAEKAAQKPRNTKTGWIVAGSILAGLLLLFLLLPRILYAYLQGKIKGATTPPARAYWSNRAMIYDLALLGMQRGLSETPLQFAGRVAARLPRSNASSFMTAYLKTKFSPAELRPAEAETIAGFWSSFKAALKEGFTGKERLKRFLKPVAAVKAFRVGRTG